MSATLSSLPTTADLLMKLDRARWWTISNQPFYGSLAMALPDILGNPHGETACTDGRRIFWDLDFLDKLTDEETRFVVMHETLHPAHGHLWRFPKADKRTNMACDYAINLTLAQIPGIKMPEGGLLDTAYANLAEEEILNRMPKDPPGGGGKGGQSGRNDPCGDFTDPAEGDSDGKEAGKNGKPGQDTGKPGKTPGNGQESDGNGQDESQGPGKAATLREQWEERVIQAAQAAKASGRGNIPAEMQGVLDRVLAQKIDWKNELADFVRDAVNCRNDWSRSARRMATAPVIYPRKRRDDLGLVVFVRDLSGSISDTLAAELSGLVTQALGDTGCRGLVIDCDTRIHAEHWLASGEECPLSRPCGGGTDFRDPFARCEELVDQGERIAGLVYLSDGDGTGGPSETQLPTLWLSTGKEQMPSGRTVFIQE